MMKLYYSPGTCSLAPHIVLRETGSEFDLVRVDLANGTTESGDDYSKFNSRNQVPLLQLDSGERLTEGAVIARYIADQKPARELLPAPETLQRYRVEVWQNYISTELHKGFAPLFHYSFADEVMHTFKNALLGKYQWLDQQLKDSKFLCGATFTVADAYLYTVTRWATPVQLDIHALTHLQDFMQRVAQRPAVREALLAEGIR
ncbi:glutathione transferase GstA [Ketobacter nezhaii]|uniref:glutathione transferase GstA n=1 Tax=Ketobacter sp. MCCC 1A13808 TaxID=2602738 RepID=UPI001E2E843C|nr:glutathione transferase GstA [Ketobacter sp. MCCC 1A13808]